MISLLAKILLILGLLLLLIANVSTDWVNLSVSRKYRDHEHPGTEKLSYDVSLDVDTGLWSHCKSISGDVLPSSHAPSPVPSPSPPSPPSPSPPYNPDSIAAGIVAGCESLEEGTTKNIKPFIVASQILSVICLVSAFLALLFSLMNINDITAGLCLVSLACGLAVLIIYAVHIANDELGSKSNFAFLKKMADCNLKYNSKQKFYCAPTAPKDTTSSSFRGYGASYWVQVVGVGLVSIAGILSLYHHTNNASSASRGSTSSGVQMSKFH